MPAWQGVDCAAPPVPLLLLPPAGLNLAALRSPRRSGPSPLPCSPRPHARPLAPACSGRLVTAQQLQAEAILMLEDSRPADALSVLELSVLFTLYPVHHEVAALADWHRSLASNDTLFAS